MTFVIVAHSMPLFRIISIVPAINKQVNPFTCLGVSERVEIDNIIEKFVKKVKKVQKSMDLPKNRIFCVN